LTRFFRQFFGLERFRQNDEFEALVFVPPFHATVLIHGWLKTEVEPGGFRPLDGLSRHIDKYAFLRHGDIGLWARCGKSAQAEAVSGEDCGDDGEHHEIGGGVGPEQSVCAELAEGLPF